MEKLNQIIEKYPQELKLLLVCCGSERWKAEELLPKINWDLFLQWVKRHRVNPHVYQFGIKNSLLFPTEILKQINETQKVNTQRMLRLTGEMLRLQKLFNDNNIHNIPFKGPALAYQLYNDPGMRHSIDLDFLILPEDLDKVSNLMVKEGYKQTNPDFNLSHKQKKVFLSALHNYNFSQIHTGLSVEIHWKLMSPNSLLINSGKLFFESFINSHPFPTINSNLLLHYLISHGSKHRWSKLFWLKDIDDFYKKGIVAKDNEFDYLTKYFTNKTIVNQSLYLSKLLFNTNTFKEIKLTKFLSLLISLALKSINKIEEENKGNIIYIINNFIYIILLKPKFIHLLLTIKEFSTTCQEWKTIPLPDYLFFLYYPLKPINWFIRHHINKKSGS